jgi:DNA-binding beta-propeller fold protein YncE
MKWSDCWYGLLVASALVITASDAAPRLTLKNAIRDRMYRPVRIAVQRSGTVASADYQRKQICFFDARFRFLSSTTVPGAPLSIALASDGNLYVGISNDVLRMTRQGTIIDRFSAHGYAPHSPVDIAVGNSGLVYVIDRQLHRVSVFSSTGDLQFSFGTQGTNDGQFHAPSGIALDAASNEIIVADAGNSRIQVFSLQGQFRRKFGEHVQRIDTTWRIIGAFAQIQGVAVDAEHRIYVTDSGLDHVQVFDGQGNHLSFLGREGHPSTRFRVPMGIAILDSSLYVTSMAGSELRAYTIEGLITTVKEPDVPLTYALEQNYPNPFNPTTSMRFSLPSDGTVTLRIYDITGREVKTLVNDDFPAGKHTINWDGRNHAGTAVASGIYFYRLHVAGKFSQTNKMIFLK